MGNLIAGSIKEDQTGKKVMKILCIDDSEAINYWVKDVLESENHEFTSVNNGKDGLQLIRDQKFDAVLLDIAMPHFSGKDVFNTLEKEGILTKQPIILFTATTITESEIGDMINRGAYKCIRKPVEIDDILGTINNLPKN